MHEYFVLVRFQSHDFIENVESYVESAVAEMQGCQRPDDPVRTIESNSVITKNMLDVDSANTIGDVCWDISKNSELK